jgi:ketosteroid isomerase-like protein
MTSFASLGQTGAGDQGQTKPGGTLDTDGVLAANAAFYRAFADADLPTLDRIVARRHAVAVIHPGWPVVIGREAVMETWQMIFTEGPQPVRPVSPEVLALGDAALVIVYEKAGDVYLAASNLFVREDDEWRLACHQAGPISAPRPDMPLM